MEDFGRSRLRKPQQALTAIIGLLAIHCTYAAPRACEESGYCSTGVSRQWVGDIRASSQLKAMLDSVAFRKEIILTIYMPQTDQPLLWLDPVHQYHHELTQMGYAHHLFVTLSEAHCNQMLLPQASCIWDSSDLPKEVMELEQALWHSRWKLMARATRLGYNIMSTDTDFIFWRDPYVHLKSGNLASAQMMCMPEGGSVFNCNGGFVYVQNARADGPVTWVFKQVIMSTLRRGDDGFEYMSQFTKEKTNCMTFDQSLIMDALGSAGVGRPLAYNALFMCKKGATFTTRLGTTLTMEQVKANILGLTEAGPRSKKHAMPPNSTWLEGLRLPPLVWDDLVATEGNLTVPNLAYGYPEELGGRMFPEAEGPLSRAFLAQLRDDCPHCPWWPEQRVLPAGQDPLEQVLGPDLASPNMTPDKMGLFLDTNIPTERLVQVPRWLSSSLSVTRRGTFTGRGAPVQGPFIMSHIHSWHLQTSRHHKIMLRKVLGRYNWTVGAAMARLGGASSPYAMRRDVRRVLALSPDVDLSRTRSWEELARIMAGLMQLAHLSRRTLLMPDLPCETAWLHDKYSRTNEKENKVACVDYTFWRSANMMPLPVSYPVDERGELVGGWSRRLAAAADSGSAASSPPHTMMHAAMMAAVPQAGEEEDGVWGSLATEREDLTGSGSSRHLLQHQSPAPVLDKDWWRRKRYMVALPAFWDQTCTLEMRAITSPEFHHWLRSDEHAAGAQLQASPANTVLLPSASQTRLQLVPPLAPGGDAAAVPRGSLVQPSAQPGWSWADVQVALPVGQVMEELWSREDVPVLYIGHPVLVVGELPGTTEPAGTSSSMQQKPEAGRRLAAQAWAGAGHGTHNAGDAPGEAGRGLQADPGDLTAAGMVGARTKALRRPKTILSRINARLRNTACKALFYDPETRQEVVPLDQGLQGQLRDRRIAAQ